MLSLDEVPIDETIEWRSDTRVQVRLHINEFDDEYAKQGRIWAVDVDPYDEPKRKYFVVKSVMVQAYMQSSALMFEQPKAYLYGFVYVIKSENRIYLRDTKS